MHTRSPLLLAIALVCALFGCTTLTRLFRPRRTVHPDLVGAVLPLSGKYEAAGKALLEGIKLGLKGSKLKLEVRDSQGEPERAVQALDELAEAGALAVLGGVVSTEALALGQRADALGVPLIAFSKDEGLTSSGSYTFRSMLTVSAQARALGRFATCELGLTSFASLAPDEPNAKALTATFTDTIRDEGGQLEPSLTYPPEQTTFTAEAKSLAGRAAPEQRGDYLARRNEILQTETDPFRRRKALEKVRSSLKPILGFQALLLPDSWKTVSLIAPAFAVEDVVTNACDAEDMRRVRATLGREKLQTITLLGGSGWQSPEGADGTPELLARGGKFMHCAYFVDGFFAGSARPATKQFVQAFRAGHGGRTPNLLHANAYDAARMVRQLSETKAPTDSGQIRDLLGNLEGFEGATGTTAFDGDREPRRPLFFLRITPEGIREVSLARPCAAALLASSGR